MELNIPLLRSRKDKRYKIDTAGSSLKSSFLNNAFSLIVEDSSSESDEPVDAPGLSVWRSIFSGTAAMFLGVGCTAEAITCESTS